ncbi:uncharacterized protein [Panulirus ornatus]|uniref:uncharacterized protein n=1 Tax=Panulirus ornatus TaxID=150431 RepID=UPI003A840991
MKSYSDDGHPSSSPFSMDAEGNTHLGGPPPSTHDFFHFRRSTFSNRQASYVNDNRDNVRLLEYENGEVQADTYMPGRHKCRFSGSERGSWKNFSNPLKHETASGMPNPEVQLSEGPCNGNCNDRPGASGSFSTRGQQHSNVRLAKSLSETVTDNIRDMYESTKNENRFSPRNSFEYSNYLRENQSPPSDYRNFNQSPPSDYRNFNQSPPSDYRNFNQSPPSDYTNFNQSPPSDYRNFSPRSTTSSTSGVEMLGMNGDRMEMIPNTTNQDHAPYRTTVKMRNKRRVNVDMNTSWPSSQIELMKRRSAEISELRHALERKIRNQTSKYSRLSSDLDNCSNGTTNFEPYSVNRRPKSAYEYPYRDNDPMKENKAPSPPLQNSNICGYTSRPVGSRYHSRNSAPPSSIDPRKLKYLMDDHRRSSPFGDQKIFGPFLCQRCSHPISFTPHAQRRTSTTVCDEGEDADSEYFTPQGSPGPRIYQPMKKTRYMEDAEETSEDPTKPEYGLINYYPNCDATIWIRSCTHEVTQPISGIQIGVIPRWLRGALIRNGPGRIQVGEEQYNHLFDGSALLHRFHFKDGKVTYQNKFLKTRSYLKDTKAQRIVVNYFGTRAHPDPCKTILQNIASKFSFEEHFTDNAQISLYPYSDGLYALTETPFMFRVDPDTLNTHERVDLTNYIAVLTHTAHPHIDKDGTVYNIGQGVGPLGPKYHICKFPNTKTDSKGKVKSPFDQAQVVGSVNARWFLNPCYMHSFAMTDNYWIIIEQPLVVSVTKIIKVILKQEALIDALQWWEKETKIHVVRRDTGSVTCTQYVTETFFFLHTINAYEDRGHIVLDIAAYKNAEMLHCMYVEALKNAAYDPTYAQMFRGRPKRWVLPLLPNKDAGRHTNLITLPGTQCHARWVKKNVVYIVPEMLANIGCEVPRIHYDEYNGRFYRYFYAICSDVDHPNPGTLVKVDVVNKTHMEWSEDNVYPSEPVFVPSPCAQREDEGVILSALLRAKGLDQQVCMVILDASTFTELGRVEFTAPGPVPKCLHGWFVREGTLKVHPDNQDKKANQER